MGSGGGWGGGGQKYPLPLNHKTECDSLFRIHVTSLEED